MDQSGEVIGNRVAVGRHLRRFRFGCKRGVAPLSHPASRVSGMTPPADASALPDEDLLAFPPAWERLVLPTRTVGKPRKLKLDPDLGHRRFSDESAWVRKVLEPMDDDEFQAAATAFLDGGPDPLGAAVVVTLVCHHLNWHDYPAPAMFHHLMTEYGLAFATRAAAEFLTLDIKWDRQDELRVYRMALNGRFWDRTVEHGPLKDFRSLLAAASETAYAEVVDALAGHRGNRALRFAVSLLVPDQQEWTLQVCREHQSQSSTDRVTELLVIEAVTTAEQFAAMNLQTLPGHYVTIDNIAGVTRRLGVDAVPILVATAANSYYTNELKALYRAFSILPSDEAVGFLTDRLPEALVVGFAMDAAKRFPQRMLRVLAARLPDADTARRKLLTELAHADPIMETALAHLDAETRATLAPLFEGSARFPEADTAELPGLLADPPWIVKGPKKKAVVIEGLVPPAINRVAWAEGERERFGEVVLNYREKKEERSWRQRAEKLARGELDADEGLQYLVYAPLEMAAEGAALWRTAPLLGYWAEFELKNLVSRFEATVSEEVAKAAATEVRLYEAAMPIANLPAARLMADGFVRLKSVRADATAWLDRHGADAAALLIPDALGKDRKPRFAAETALHYLASKHGRDLVQGAAAQYGDEAAAAIGALLDVDPLMPVGVKIPKPSPWVAPALLPQVLLSGGKRALPHEAVGHLVIVLSVATPEFPYAGVDVVAGACDRGSLNRFSLALFERWLAAGAPSADGWALTQLSHFADDHTVRSLSPLVAKWPGENQHQRAVKGLQVLGAIGTEAAMRAIQGIAEKARFDGIRWEARSQIEAIAARLGLTADQLADRLVPTFGLDEESALVLDYGPRTFIVAFDEHLKPYVTDEAGKPRKTLPKPSAKDDERIAEDAYLRFSALKKEMRTAAADQVRRLEAAMVKGRKWNAEEFREFFAEHALTKHLARRLVWQAEVGGEWTGFRIAEDGTYSDVEDETLDLPADTAIRLLHPALLAADRVAAWAEILADYEVLQPFDQLSRPVYAFTEGELKTGRLTRFEGFTVDPGRILGMTKRGWDRAGGWDGGGEPGISFPLPGSGYVTMDLDPGIYAGAAAESGNQTLLRVRLATTEKYRHEGELEVPTDIDPVAASEALAALDRLTAAK